MPDKALPCWICYRCGKTLPRNSGPAPYCDCPRIHYHKRNPTMGLAFALPIEAPARKKTRGAGENSRRAS